MLKIALTGANSFIGHHLLNTLADEPVLVKTLSRNMLSTRIKSDNITSYCGDLLDYASLNGFVEDCDILVNLAYLWNADCCQNLKAIDNLLAVCKQHNVKKFIQCSTSSVYGNTKNSIINENTACIPKTEYAKIKYSIEQYLLNNCNNAFQLAILRPTQVFGLEGKNLVKLVNDLRYGSKFKNYIKSCLSGYRRMNLVSVENVVAALYFLVQAKKLQNQIYLISDDEAEDNIFKTVESTIKNHLKNNSYGIPSFYAPLFFYKAMYRLMGKGEINPNTAYLGINLSMEGFVKPIHFKQSLQRYIEECCLGTRS